MDNATLNINKENVLNTYAKATDEQKTILEIIFGKDTFKPKNIMDRIKTFEDACNELGNDHPLVLAYQNTNLRDKEVADENKDIIAYLKLRIIVAALNEGWEPQFTPMEHHWAPYYTVYNKDEIDGMSEEVKARVFSLSGKSDVIAGISYAGSGHAFAYVHASTGSRLSLHSSDLAEYAGQQFIGIYADLILD